MNARGRLIAATQTLLWDSGYAATSPRDIQRAAGAGQGSMYHHFRDKQELATEALNDSAKTFRAATETLLQGPGTPLERLVGYLQLQRDCLRGCPIGRMTYDPAVIAAPALREPVAATFAWLVDATARVVAEGVADSGFPADTDCRALAAAMVAVVQGGYVLARAQQEPAPFHAAIAGAVELLKAWAT